MVLPLNAYCVGMPSPRKNEKTYWGDPALTFLTGIRNRSTAGAAPATAAACAPYGITPIL